MADNKVTDVNWLQQIIPNGAPLPPVGQLLRGLGAGAELLTPDSQKVAHHFGPDIAQGAQVLSTAGGYDLVGPLAENQWGIRHGSGYAGQEGHDAFYINEANDLNALAAQGRLADPSVQQAFQALSGGRGGQALAYHMQTRQPFTPEELQRLQEPFLTQRLRGHSERETPQPDLAAGELVAPSPSPKVPAAPGKPAPEIG